MWDESKAGRGGEEISSAIFKWAKNVIHNSACVNEIKLWSDNCFGQNKNISIIMCFFWIMQKYPQIERINMKYLLKGHTHMEADIVHALIERKRKKLKNMMILTPWDWQQMVRQCSSNYNVLNMEQEDFLQFNVLFEGKNSFIGNKMLKKRKYFFHPLFTFKCDRKIQFDAVDLNRIKRRSGRLEDSRDKFLTHLPVKSAVPISQQKFNDLISLLSYVPSVCHSFYMNLPKKSNKTRDYPNSDDKAMKCSHRSSEDLWQSDGTGADLFSCVMSERRFRFLLRCISNCKKSYSISEYACVDEKLQSFRGRCLFRQYIPNKPAKNGIKIFALYDNITYYTSTLEIYAGKQPDGQFPIYNSASEVVKRLVSPISKTGRNITANNWFASVSLAEELLKNHYLTLVATINKNKKEILKEFLLSKNRELCSSYFGFQNNKSLVS
ncbi:hypothetical protein AGLY_011953 [Aphis glycines]|uniref:Uncharacterized protein n=1 Tax=Aphis glycines TaxID=307491 RepID=A0A6G0TCK4_APHGL|nr:hypothetical protein AGLY_011953 [Aphis glycines]